MITIDRSRLKMLKEREVRRYTVERPKSEALFRRARNSLLAGVPMNWLRVWPGFFPDVWEGPFPFFAKEAKGAWLTDVDGHRYLDLILADHPALFGHSPAALVDAVTDQLQRGIALLAPTEDSIWVGEELARRFGLPFWQICMTATDANRFALKVAREITKRELILVFNGSYHGTVDETLVKLEDGVVRPDPDCIGPLPNAASSTRIIEFNDLDALEAALSHRDIACVLCEPELTNVGIVHVEPGYHTALRDITRRAGTLLIIDETHTITCGPGGLTRLWNLEPDIFTLGKPIASGVPAAVMGLSREIAEKLEARMILPDGYSGLGGTLSGNQLATVAIKATLEHIMTQSTYDWTIGLAKQLADGMDTIIKAADLPWHVTCSGCKVQCSYRPTHPRNATESAAAFDTELDSFNHLFFINRGILTSPWRNLKVHIAPQVKIEDIDFYNNLFGECVKELVG